jgi:hypothetical protein
VGAGAGAVGHLQEGLVALVGVDQKVLEMKTQEAVGALQQVVTQDMQAALAWLFLNTQTYIQFPIPAVA